jgi:hypothetical protein
MLSVVSQDTTLGEGEHHTNRTGRDEKERVPAANALAGVLARAEQRGQISYGGKCERAKETIACWAK